MNLTVALPIYNSGTIAWLALESLCRQKGIDFEWELIIMEESQPNPFGLQKVNEYADRLKAAGCVRINYHSLDQWIPLAEKWRRIAQHASETECFILQAADCYSQPFRLAESLQLIRAGNDWVQSKTGIFYDIKTKTEILYNHNLYDHPCALNMATRTGLAKQLPAGGPRAGVDSWFKRSLTAIKPDLKTGWNDSVFWVGGFDSSGLNNISKRAGYFANPTPPFQTTFMKIADYIPTDIVQKIESLC